MVHDPAILGDQHDRSDQAPVRNRTLDDRVEAVGERGLARVAWLGYERAGQRDQDGSGNSVAHSGSLQFVEWSLLKYTDGVAISRVVIVKNRLSRRPRGRPRSFDRDTVLAAAADTFWRLGYEGASIVDLTAAMGITPQSLYSAFTSKADLYREALAWYQANVGAFANQALTEEGDVVAAFARMLQEAARTFSQHRDRRGCMISTAVLACAEENHPVAEHAATLRRATCRAFQARLERGVADGQLHPDTDTGAVARYLGAILQGMSVQAHDGAGEKDLAGIAAIAIGALLRHRA